MIHAWALSLFTFHSNLYFHHFFLLKYSFMTVILFCFKLHDTHLKLSIWITLSQQYFRVKLSIVCFTNSDKKWLIIQPIFSVVDMLFHSYSESSCIFYMINKILNHVACSKWATTLYRQVLVLHNPSNKVKENEKIGSLIAPLGLTLLTH